MEIITMDNEVVKTMMEKIDRIADYVSRKITCRRRKLKSC